MNTFIAESTKSRVLLTPQATGSGDEAYLAPAAGSKAINIRCIATKGNAADLVLSLRYADDASGTSAADYEVTVPVYENGVRQTDAKAYTIDNATGDFIVDFCIDPATVPQDKFIGISYADSNAGNLLAVEMIEDSADKPAV
jgi:hypothetical protein